MRQKREQENCCPFIDLDDTRCARLFSLSRLSKAMDLCLNNYWQCPTFYQMQLEKAGEHIGLTIRGKPYVAATV